MVSRLEVMFQHLDPEFVSAISNTSSVSAAKRIDRSIIGSINGAAPMQMAGNRDSPAIVEVHAQRVGN